MGTLASELQAIAQDLAAAPRVYVDANVPVGAVDRMRRDLSWDVLFVLEHEDLRRARDTDHYNRAFDLGRTLITLDRDFLDDRAFPLTSSPGVIVCSAPDERLLVRLLHYIDQTVFDLASRAEPPLRGRKLSLTTDVLFKES
jgi:predicted nuclease of predicted toxin-antitoxin system